MSYTTFSKNRNNQLLEPMFFGQNVNVSRYDQQKYGILEKLIEMQLGFFWQPGEIDLSKDLIDFTKKLTEPEKHIFLSNLKYQTLLDSVAARSPNVSLLPIVSIPELESWVETWSFSEVVHSRSYTHIIRNAVNTPDTIFDDIVDNEEIKVRAETVTAEYDKLIALTMEMYHCKIDLETNDEFRYTIKAQLYRVINSVNILEAIRFYVSFACSFAFAERKLMEGSAKIIKLIARDEALHLAGTQFLINTLRSGQDDPEFVQIAKDLEPEMTSMFLNAAQEEKIWAKYLFIDGSMIGLNEKILGQYVDFVTHDRMTAIGLNPGYDKPSNPIPWINAHLSSDEVQVAPQETELSSYLTGATDSTLDEDAFSEFGDFS